MMRLDAPEKPHRYHNLLHDDHASEYTIIISKYSPLRITIHIVLCINGKHKSQRHNIIKSRKTPNAGGLSLKVCLKDRCAILIHHVLAALTRSSVHLVGGLQILRLLVRGRHSRTLRPHPASGLRAMSVALILAHMPKLYTSFLSDITVSQQASPLNVDCQQKTVSKDVRDRINYLFPSLSYTG